MSDYMPNSDPPADNSELWRYDVKERDMQEGDGDVILNNGEGLESDPGPERPFWTFAVPIATCIIFVLVFAVLPRLGVSLGAPTEIKLNADEAATGVRLANIQDMIDDKLGEENADHQKKMDELAGEQAELNVEREKFWRLVQRNHKLPQDKHYDLNLRGGTLKVIP